MCVLVDEVGRRSEVTLVGGYWIMRMILDGRK